MNIIKTDLVSAAHDVMWEDVSGMVKDANQRPVLILVQAYQQGSNEGAQLIKMLEAAKLQPEQYNIIQLEKGKVVAWHQLRERLNPHIIFLIGILPIQLGISSLFRLNAPNHFNDRVWLPTLSLAELEQRPDVKKQLWLDGIKPVFVDSTFK
jgi:hypothetical protein